MPSGGAREARGSGAVAFEPLEMEDHYEDDGGGSNGDYDDVDFDDDEDFDDEVDGEFVRPGTVLPQSLSMESEDSDDADMQHLLGSAESGSNHRKAGGASALKRLRPSQRAYCCGAIRPMGIGNMSIFSPRSFASNGWGVLGPHWFGPVCVVCILCVATYFCVRSSLNLNGVAAPITAGICVFFCAACIFMLGNVSLRDPGICRCKVIPEEVTDPNQAREYRWCDFCQVFQPPDGAHCPDCNVCVAGYDHHCVWMGTCIGKKNYRQFVKFNIAWLYYLLFTIFWISAIGPLAVGVKHHKHRHGRVSRYNHTIGNHTVIHPPKNKTGEKPNHTDIHAQNKTKADAPSGEGHPKEASPSKENGDSKESESPNSKTESTDKIAQKESDQGESGALKGPDQDEDKPLASESKSSVTKDEATKAKPPEDKSTEETQKTDKPKKDAPTEENSSTEEAADGDSAKKALSGDGPIKEKPNSESTTPKDGSEGKPSSNESKKTLPPHHENGGSK